MSDQQPLPNIFDLNYRMRQLSTDVMNHEGQITGLQNSISANSIIIESQNTWLLTLLVSKAILKIPSQIDDYVNMLCTLYKPKGPLPPDVATDTTPPWMIALSIISVTNTTDKNAYIDIFRYVYGYSPYIFFSTTTT